jgi:hypothetical protein
MCWADVSLGLEVAGGVRGDRDVGGHPRVTDVAAMGELGLLECIAAAGTVNLLAEQNAQFASGPASSGYVIDKGQIRNEGPLAELLQAEAVITRHLPV